MGRKVRFALGWIAAAVVLGILVRAVSLDAVVAAFRTTDPWLAATGFVLALLSQAIVAVRLRLLSGAFALGLSISRLYRINLAALFYGMFAPAGSVTSVVVRYYRISRPRGEYSGGAAALLIDRLAATAALCAVGLAGWVATGDAAGRVPAAIMAPALLALLVAAVLLLTPYAVGAVRWLDARLPPRVALARAARRARSLGAGTLVAVAALAVAANLVGVLAYQALAAGLGLDLPFLTMAWVRSGAMLAAMLPVAVGGLGVRDAALLAMLAPLGVAGGVAVAFSLSVFAWTTAAVGLAGGALEALGLVRRAAGGGLGAGSREDDPPR